MDLTGTRAGCGGRSWTIAAGLTLLIFMFGRG
jgi:hypothetical protein